MNPPSVFRLHHTPSTLLLSLFLVIPRLRPLLFPSQLSCHRSVACSLVLPAILITLSHLPLHAQADHFVGPSILTRLRPHGILQVGQPLQASLTSAHVLTTQLHRVAAWTINGSASSATYQLDLRSPDFDSYLYVLGVTRFPLTTSEQGPYLTDDDSGDGLDARLCFSVPRQGTYYVVAAALDGGLGTYSLQLAADCDDPESSVPPILFSDDGRAFAGLPISLDRQLLPGDEVDSNLTSQDPLLDQRHVQAWSLWKARNETLSITLTSNAFDPYLVVMSPDGILFADDDGGDAFNAMLALPVGIGGTYRLFVTSFSSRANGPFQLKVLRQRR